MNTAILIERASALAELMTLCEEIGAAARVEEGGVHLLGPGGAGARPVGATVPEAARRLRALCGASDALGPRVAPL